MSSAEQDFELLDADADADDGSVYEIVKVYRRRRRARPSPTSEHPVAERAPTPPYPPYPPMPPYPPYPPYVIVTGGCSCGAATGGRGMGLGVPFMGGALSGFASVPNPTLGGTGAPSTSVLTPMTQSSSAPAGQPGPVPTPSALSLLLDLADHAALPGLLP